LALFGGHQKYTNNGLLKLMQVTLIDTSGNKNGKLADQTRTNKVQEDTRNKV